MANVNPTYREISKRLAGERGKELLDHKISLLVYRKPGALLDDPIEAVMRVLHEENPDKRIEAITLLCSLGQSFHGDRLLPLMKDPIPGVRANAVYAFGLQGGAEDMATLQTMLDDPSAVVRYCAREALELLRKKSSLESHPQ